MDENGDDPFASLAHLCTLSDSQEEFLRRCPFAGDASAFSDSQGFPLQDAVAVAVAVADGAEVVVQGGSIGGATAIDLGKDTDLGFQSEVQSTQRIAEIGNTGVCRTEIAESEPASKRLKSSEEALRTASSGPTVGEQLPVDLDSTKLTEKLVTKNNGVAEDLSKIDDGKGSSGDQSRRVLPSSINGAKGDAEKKTKESDSGKPMSIFLEMLKMIADEEGEEDDSLANLSILDIVVRRGMTFPRPCWWPEGQDFSFK